MGLIIEGGDYRPMDRKNLIQQVEENVEEDEAEGVPVCGANLSSPVFDTANYIEQVQYKIGTRLYIENAD
jgi:hypothetical protein